ncbi:MAG: hypothetical protein LQ350_007277 [Teloschistes chrysophthalmus]|nr:MAG: hypothetical protein LQ350_007277 [Niorma chrysophthalma]
MFLELGMCIALPNAAGTIGLHPTTPHRSSSLAVRIRHADEDDTSLTPSHPLLPLLPRGSGGYNLRSSSLRHPATLGTFSLVTSVIRTFSAIIPADAAAQYIVDFLNIIALRIETGEWAAHNTAPTHHRVLNLWSFELSFLAIDGQARAVPVPWEMVQAYVIDLAEDVGRGFTGAFEESLVGWVNGVATVVTVSLKMKTAGQGAKRGA